MKIILAAINAKYIHSNLAVHTLKKYAETKGNIPFTDIEISEYTINQRSMDIMRDLYVKKADVICFSCYIWNISFVREIASELKKVSPWIKVWCGGPEVSYHGAYFMEENPFVNGVMTGEGEKSFLDLYNFYHENGTASPKQPEGLRGIIYRDEENRIITNEPQQILDMNDIPFCYEDMASFENKIIYYESSRGCPFSCSYCLSSVEKRLRFRSFDLVEEELRFLVSQKVPQIKFVDRTFNCNHEHAMKILKLVKEIDLGITNFHFEISADLLTRDEVEFLSTLRPGLVQFEVGVQSTNADTVSEIHRTMDLARVKERVMDLQKSGNIHQHLDLIAGLPYEDYKTFQKSFQEIYELKPNQLQLGFLKVLKGSYIHEKAQYYEMKYQDQPPYEILQTKWISFEEILKIKLVEEMLEVYYNSGQFEITMKLMDVLFPKAFDFFLELGEFYEQKGYLDVKHTRNRRCEILIEFIEYKRKNDLTIIREALTFDIYYRENAKSRPSFAGISRISKSVYRKLCPNGKLSHAELFHYRFPQKQDLYLRELPAYEEAPVLIHFAYDQRDPLDHQARTREIKSGEVQDEETNT